MLQVSVTQLQMVQWDANIHNQFSKLRRPLFWWQTLPLVQVASCL